MPFLRKQLLDSSRGRLVSLLRRGRQTADDMAAALGLTRSAIRAHLTAMERDGLVRRAGQRRGATRPSLTFELTPDVEQALSRAYVPVLVRLIDVIAEGLPADHLDAMLRRTGRRLAEDLSRGRRPAGSLASRVAAASEMLNEQLGALTHVESNGHHVIRGLGCPLAAVTGKHPGVCRALEAMLTEVVGAPVRECCDRTGRPRCCFKIGRRPTRRRAKKTSP